jgi:hypothetical protein
MLFREIITVYSENHMKSVQSLCRQNAVLQNIKAGSIEAYFITVFHKVNFIGNIRNTIKHPVLEIWLINSILNKKNRLISERILLMYQFTRRPIKLTVLIIVEYHCYQLHTNILPSKLSP